MKKTIWLFLSMFFYQAIVFGQTAEKLYEQASDFYDKEEFAKAFTLVNEALKKSPGNSKYLLLKGNIYSMTSQYQEAYDTYTAGIQRDSSNAYLYNQRGLLLQRVRQPENAIIDYSAALKLRNSDTMKVSLFLNRGASKIDIRDFQGAYDDFMEALKLDSLNIGTLNNLAAVCDEVGKGELTLMYLNKILKIDSTFIGAYGNIGFKYQEMGDYKTAIRYFNKVLEMAPDEPLGYSNRAFNKYKLGELESALSDINKAISLYPANSYAYWTRALIFLAMNEKVMACRDIEEALRKGYTKMYGDAVELLKKQNCSGIKN